ncbi:MAG: hypothetical protein ACRCXA_04200 [Peptostreptococcaceae bacterium]
MNKRKVSAILGIMVACSINLLGCSKVEDEGNEVKQNNESINSKARDFKMLSNKNGCSTKDGYYTISTTENEEMDTVMNLMYVDYKTKNQIYLCDKSECNHNTDNCTSYIEPKYFGRQNSIVSDEKYLYFISSEYNRDGATDISIVYGGGGGSPKSEPTSIYRMNLDGSNKILLSSLESGELLGEDFFTDGNYMYFINMKNSQVKIDDNTSYTDGDNYNLIKISRETGEKEQVMKWNRDWKILGCYKDRIVVNKIVFDKELTVEDRLDDAKYTKACKTANEVIVSYDIHNQQFEELFTNKLDEGYQYVMHQNDLFYYKYKGNKINSFDIEDKVQSDSIETNYSNIQQIYDGYIIASDWKENNKEFYRIRIEDKDTSKLNLYKENGYLVNIIGESEDAFFVESNCKVKNEYVEWAGANQTVETDREYSMISKEDYFNNKKNFEKVNTIVEDMN